MPNIVKLFKDSQLKLPFEKHAIREQHSALIQHFSILQSRLGNNKVIVAHTFFSAIESELITITWLKFFRLAYNAQLILTL